MSAATRRQRQYAEEAYWRAACLNSRIAVLAMTALATLHPTTYREIAAHAQAYAAELRRRRGGA